jgi:hypothetical protein
MNMINRLILQFVSKLHFPDWIWFPRGKTQFNLFRSAPNFNSAVYCIFRRPPAQVLLKVLVLLAAINVTAAQSDRVQQFKDFVAHPPASVKCVFRQITQITSSSTLLGITNQGVVTNLPTNHLGTNIFEVIWQTNAALVRNYFSEPAYILSRTRTTECVAHSAGQFNSYAWDIGVSAFVEYENSPSFSLQDNIAQQTINGAIDRSFSRVMNAGLQLVQIGSLQWSGNSLAYTDQRGWRCQADLIVSNAMPSEMFVTLTNLSGQVYHQHFIYTLFSNTTLPFLPSQITYLNAQGATSMVFDIGHIDVSSIPLSKSSFEPDNYLHRRLVSVITYKSSGERQESLFDVFQTRRSRSRHLFFSYV